MIVSHLCYYYFFMFLSKQTCQTCLSQLLSLDDFTLKLSYPDLPLYSHLFSQGFHSPPHHLLTTTPPPISLAPFKLLPCQNEISHVQMESCLAGAQCSLWLLVTYRIESHFLHCLALPTCSTSSFAVFSCTSQNHNSVNVFSCLRAFAHLFLLLKMSSSSHLATPVQFFCRIFSFLAGKVLLTLHVWVQNVSISHAPFPICLDHSGFHCACCTFFFFFFKTVDS